MKSLRDCTAYCDNESYVSIARTGQMYTAIMQDLCTVVPDPAQAQIALLHQTPILMQAMLQQVPALNRTYLIGFFVWEADRLTVEMQQGLRRVDEIWTPSAYCYEIFSRYHPRVTYVPHVIETDMACSAQDMAELKALIHLNPRTFNYLAITRQKDLRKNVASLVQAFDYVVRRVPHARLIIKDTGSPGSKPIVINKHGVTYLYSSLSQAMINALYRTSHVYVSAHCGEGWGLPLSDAMLFGKLVVGTAYSGNMDFMTPHNALLVPYTEENIRPSDVYYRFDTSMRWAYAHREGLERQMLAAYHMSQDGRGQACITQASQDIGVFDRAHVTRCMRTRLQEIFAGLQDGSLRKIGQRPPRLGAHQSGSE